MQLVDTSAGNSCHGYPQMQCSLLCFVSFWLIIEWGENGTQVQEVGKVLHELSLGKFLIGTEIFCRSGNFFCESCCDGNNLLCVVLAPSEGWRHLQQAIYMGRSCHVVGGMCECTLFSASLPLHKWKWSCVAVWLSGWNVALAIQQAPRVKYFSLLHRRQWQKSFSLVFICHAGLKDSDHSSLPCLCHRTSRFRQNFKSTNASTHDTLMWTFPTKYVTFTSEYVKLTLGNLSQGFVEN